MASELLQATRRDYVFLELKGFHFISILLCYEEFWDLLYALMQFFYPIYSIVRLASMQGCGIDRLKYYICQTDTLLDEGLKNLKGNGLLKNVLLPACPVCKEL